ncbi:phosphoribosyltransferase [Sutterella sp.]|uniref:phosphoribosyltransferase n=1 Tax=Sutterella sp. TaxID=1981025 RepID=UPI0026E000FB|nr:phosphoribosyltransferase family protein [Sutterella sp.]MDO5530573.1 phosphoribosyltransferase family protein [Sutterella sp.]
MSDIHYTWDEYIDLNEQLVYKVAKSGWQFDCLLCLSRGGMRPGDFFSRVYNMPLAILATSSYREAKGTVQSELDIADCMTGLSELKGRVLLVDDMVDSGKTIKEVIAHLKARYPKITEIRVAVLWWKAHSVLKPDWHVAYLEDNPWIHQPFEVYDDLGAENLIARVEAKAKKA